MRYQGGAVYLLKQGIGGTPGMFLSCSVWVIVRCKLRCIATAAPALVELMLQQYWLSAVP